MDAAAADRHLSGSGAEEGRAEDADAADPLLAVGGDDRDALAAGDRDPERRFQGDSAEVRERTVGSPLRAQHCDGEADPRDRGPGDDGGAAADVGSCLRADVAEPADLAVGAAQFALESADGKAGVEALAVEFDRAAELADFPFGLAPPAATLFVLGLLGL